MASSHLNHFTRPVRRANNMLRLALIVIMTMVLVLYLNTSWSRFSSSVDEAMQDRHPIALLVRQAQADFRLLISKESPDIQHAAVAYRTRRGRHPPPHFDVWFEYARSKDAIVIEDIFDQMYHDLGPFWGQPAGLMRREAANFEMTINVRDGNATTGSDWFWTQIWLNMIQRIEHLLPDMDIPLNAMDEPRLVVPSEEIGAYMVLESQSRKLSSPANTINQYSRLSEYNDNNISIVDKAWNRKYPYWDIAIRGCALDSLARNAERIQDFDHSPYLSTLLAKPHSYEGFVSNFSLSVDYCHQPDLQGLHGTFIEPLTISSTGVLFPMFGGSKLSTNNEILLPAPMYWADDEKFSTGDYHGGLWRGKKNKAIWRGAATGGRNRAENWKGFQRHRFVAMLNGTQAALAENLELPQNWQLPVHRREYFNEWVSTWADAAFTDLNCWPVTDCTYIDPYFSTKPSMPMSTQFSNKYLPDIDGNSFSGRYRSFLLSSSLPIKATIFKEWHDSRLVPWKHFVPMDNRFVEFYDIMEYFLEHDAEAEKIATDGQKWAARVLRREDMEVYVLRLLLEYARISRDERDYMGFVGDLVGL